ncbi:hypothetical protein C8F01DRAFT_1137801 [Mycena amicta]|nr:hypothetical protein C8F01DRAFT_1137801 [Mycena amicta]
MSNPAPRLPKPFAEGPNASAEEQEVWTAAIDTFINHLVAHKLSHQATAAQLFLEARFNSPHHRDLLYYYACASLFTATQENSEAGDYIPLIAELFKLLKEEGLRRDKDRYAYVSWGNAVVFPTLRAVADDIPAPPGYKLDEIKYQLVPDAEYVKNDTHNSELASYVRKHEGKIRFWSLVGRLEALHVFGDGDTAGYMSLLYHSGGALLRALEQPALRGVWETAWAAVPMLRQGNGGFPSGKWNGGDGDRERKWRASFLDAASKIAGDERASLEWRGRFAVIVESLQSNR